MTDLRQHLNDAYERQEAADCARFEAKITRMHNLLLQAIGEALYAELDITYNDDDERFPYAYFVLGNGPTLTIVRIAAHSHTHHYTLLIENPASKSNEPGAYHHHTHDAPIEDQLSRVADALVAQARRQQIAL